MGGFVPSPQQQEHTVSRGCHLWNLTQSLHRHHLNLQQQLLSLSAWDATSQPKHINTAWPQKPLSQTRVTHPTEWPRDTTGTRAEPRPAPLHAKPTQPADPPRAALQLLSAAQPGPNGQMGFLAYSLCLVSSFMKSDLKAIYWRGYSECSWTRGMSTQKSTSAACWSTCL